MNTWKGLAHAALFTDDLEKTIAFYENLGGKCTMRGEAPKPQWVNQLAMIEICGFALEVVQPGGGDPVAVKNDAFRHIAIEVENLEEAIEEVKSRGVDSFLGGITEMPGLFGGVRNAFFTGPSGEQIELMQKM